MCAARWSCRRPRGAAVGIGSGARPFVGFAAAHGGDALAQRDLEAPRWPGVVVEVGNGDARQPLANRALDLSEVIVFLRRDKRERVADSLGACGAADAMNVV